MAIIARCDSERNQSIVLLWHYGLVLRRWTFFASCFLLVYLAGFRCSGEELLRERFIREAPKGWQELQKMLGALEGEGEFIDSAIGAVGASRNEKLRPDKKGSFRFKVKGEQLVQIIIGEGGTEGAQVANSDYSFSVGRSSSGDEWVLQRVTRYGSKKTRIDSSTSVIARSREVGALRYLEAPWSMLGFSFSDLLADPGFSIDAVEQVEDRTSSYVKVVFSYERSELYFGVKLKIPRGVVVFDPSNYWAIQNTEADVTLNQSGTLLSMLVKGSVEYKADADGSFFPSRVWSSKLDPDSGAGQESDFHFTKLNSLDEISDSEFRLTSFGFDEDAEITMTVDSGSSLWLYINILLIIVIAIYIWHKKSRNIETKN